MIGKLYGIVDEISDTSLILKTSGGVGYKVFLPLRATTTLKKDASIELYIYTHVRETEITLFGFTNLEEERLFTILISVSGVGPKTALTILSAHTADKLIVAVQAQDVAYFSTIPGIGKKTAQKILLELANKFGAEFDLAKTNVNPDDQTVIDALMQLGFKKPEALKAVEKLPSELSIEQKITKALQQLEKN